MAETYDVYFSPVGQELSLIAFDIEATEFEIPYPLNYNTEYQWRVDAINAAGITEGDVWTFTGLIMYPPVASRHPVTDNLSGDNGMITLARLVVVSDNKVFYET